MTGSGWGRCGLTISVHHHYTGYALILMLWFASALSVTSYEASGVDQDEGIDIPLAGASVHQILSQLRNTPGMCGRCIFDRNPCIKAPAHTRTSCNNCREQGMCACAM
eukprot:m.44426 g.44426  ORF g.44426 m.44426 type:complete len:108 (-) comp10830_c0_seq4:2325-2648(-)